MGHFSKILTVAVLMVALIGRTDFLEQPAAAKSGGIQRVEAIVRHTTSYGTGECRFEAHRISMLLTGEPQAVNGQVGYSFAVRPATVGGRFLLRPNDGIPRAADLAVAFYASLGDRTDPGARPERVVVDEERGGLASETGKVPKDLPVAIVCMYAGESPVDFTYVARPPA